MSFLGGFSLIANQKWNFPSSFNGKQQLLVQLAITLSEASVAETCQSATVRHP